MYRLSVAVCSSKQIWNDEECKCKCREDLVDRIACDKGFSCNPSDYSCECDKSCGIGEYLYYKNCVCKETLLDKLVHECTSVIEENKIYNPTLNTVSSNECASCTLYVVLFAVFLAISLIIGSAFVYFYWHKQLDSEKNCACINFNPRTQINY